MALLGENVIVDYRRAENQNERWGRLGGRIGLPTRRVIAARVV
jgi:hypothetical protein